jgi:hypothetical protein
MKGEYELFGKAEALYNDLGKITGGESSGESYFSEKTRYINNFKKVIMICIHGAMKQFAKNLISEQEVLNNIADMMMETYVSESLLLRVTKLESLNGNKPVYRDTLDVNIYDTAEIVRKSSSDAVYSFASPETTTSLIKAIEALTAVRGVNVKDARRRIADILIENNKYSF